MKFSKAMIAGIQNEADWLRVPAAHYAAVIQVESNGQVSAGLPDSRKSVIRWEGHYFDRRLTGRAREAARSAGLASPKAGGVKNPRSQADRYKLLQRAVEFCKQWGLAPALAYESASWGLGQVMGAHWKAFGYATAEDFVAEVNSGIAGQLRVISKFIKANFIDDELRAGLWSAFARVYNGSGYKKNAYHTKLASAAKSLQAMFGSKAIVAVPDGFLRLGAKGARVRELQPLLVRAGYALTTDGDIGPATRDALKAFQKAEGLPVDGVYGPQTEGKLVDYRQPGEADIGVPKVTDIDAVKRGVGGGVGGAAVLVSAKTAIQGAADQLAPYADAGTAFQYLQGGLTAAAAILTVAGVGYAVYGWIKARRTQEA